MSTEPAPWIENPDVAPTLYEFLVQLATDPMTDYARAVVRLRFPGQKTIIIGVEPEEYEADEDDDL